MSYNGRPISDSATNLFAIRQTKSRKLLSRSTFDRHERNNHVFYPQTIADIFFIAQIAFKRNDFLND